MMLLRQRVGVCVNTRSQTCYFRIANHLDHSVAESVILDQTSLSLSLSLSYLE
jgi:hypothetical protein